MLQYLTNPHNKGERRNPEPCSRVGHRFSRVCGRVAHPALRDRNPRKALKSFGLLADGRRVILQAAQRGSVIKPTAAIDTQRTYLTNPIPATTIILPTRVRGCVVL